MSTFINNLKNVGENISAIAGNDTLCTLVRNGGAFIGSLIGANSEELRDLMVSINDQPSLCYVPIQAENLVMRRQADIGTTMLISQSDQSKDYITDNAAPRPRTWSIQGYIKSLIPIAESGLLIKPTLQMQKIILETASESRQTVPFKTDDGEVIDVLIQDLQIGSVPKGMNVRTISVTVQEVKVLTSAVAGDRDLDSIESNSITVNTVLNCGRNNAIIYGTAKTAAVLLRS